MKLQSMKNSFSFFICCVFCCTVSVIYSCKCFLQAGQDKSCTELQKWSKDIVNHFWYVCKTANSMDEFMVSNVFKKTKELYWYILLMRLILCVYSVNENKCIFLKCGFLYRECGLVFFTMWWTNTSGICLTVKGESVHVRMIHCRIQFATKFGWRKEALPMMHSGKSFLTKDSWTMFIFILTSGKLHIYFFFNFGVWYGGRNNIWVLLLIY